MEKAYMITDEDNLLMGIVKTDKRSKALYECWTYWEKDLNLTFLEFSKCMSCKRYKELDDLDFFYFDGRDTSKEVEKIMKIYGVKFGNQMSIDNLTQKQKKEISELMCNEEYGFEGRDTFMPCKVCIVCLCRKELDKKI